MTTQSVVNITFEQIEFSDTDDLFIEKASCSVLLKSKANKQTISSQSIKTSEIYENIIIPSDPDAYFIKLVFTSEDLKKLGSISLPCELFFPTDAAKEFSQWLTLFDDPDDDIFDGDLGQDDYEYPRALITFSLFFTVENKQKKEKENHLYDSFGGLSLRHSTLSENNTIDPIILEKFNPKNISFVDQPEELIKHFDNMLSHVGSPEELIVATHKINEFRDELEHPMANEFIKRSSSFQPKSEEFHLIDKFNKEYEEEIGLLKLKIKRFEGVQGEYDQVKNEKKICEEKYDNLLKSYQESLISMETKVKELLKENNILVEKNFKSEQENLQRKKKIDELIKANNSLASDIKNLAEINGLKEKEITLKNQSFEIFTKEFKEKFERLKGKVQEEENTKLRLLNEQKELILKYKQQLEETSTNKQNLLELETKSKIDLEKIQSELEKQNKFYQQEIDNLTKSLHERDWVIKQMEEEKTHNLAQFQALKNEIDELRTEKNERVDHLNSLIEEYENKILLLEKENNKLEVANNKNEVDYNSERQEELLEKIKMLEAYIDENDNNKQKLKNQWIETQKSFEEKLKEVERIKEDYINRFLEENRLKQSKIDENEKVILEKTRKMSELEFKINELNAKLNCENYWDSFVQKLKKKVKDLKITIESLENDKQKVLKGLYKVTQELIRQTNVSIDQSHTINLLSNEIQRLEANLQAAQEQLEELIAKQKNNSASSRSIKKTNEEQMKPEKVEIIEKNENQKIEKFETNLDKNELDEKLEKYVTEQNIPLSFEKIAEGQYRFGTRIVQAKIWKDKITIRMGGGFMMIKEFIRLFMLQEIKKLKKSGRFSLGNSKNPTPKEVHDLGNRKESNLRKNVTLENLEGTYYLNPNSKNDFI